MNEWTKTEMFLVVGLVIYLVWAISFYQKMMKEASLKLPYDPQPAHWAYPEK